MDWTVIITGIISALTGGALASFLTYKLGNRKQDESEFSTLVKEYKEMVLESKKDSQKQKEDISKLYEKIDSLEKLVFAKETEINQLRNQLMIFESSNVDVPIPLWLKDVEGKMLFINKEYERAILNPIGKSESDYIGRTDIEVWGNDIGKTFLEHDRKVIRSKRPTEFTEGWTGQNGNMYEGKVIKYPRFLDRTVIGIGGIIIDMYKV